MASLTEVEVPDIGDFEDVPIVEILVSVGDVVAEEDPLVALESDKATMEVPAPVAGEVVEIHVSVGDTVSEGARIMSVKPTDDADAGEAESTSGDVVSGDEGDDDAQAEGDADGEPDGESPDPAGEDAAEDPDEAAAEARNADESTDAPAGGAVDAEAAAGDEDGSEKPSTGPGPAKGSGDAVYASPSVRRLARELGVDLSAVEGSGRKGRIVPEDVQRAKDAPAKEAPMDEPAAKPAAGGGDPGLDLAPWPTVDYEKFGEVERVPLSRIQKIAGRNLARNWVRIPHVTHSDEADITELEAFRKQLNAEQSDVKVTMVALLLKACSASLREHPTLNSSLDEAAGELVLRKYHHLGFAADTPNGLVVPVIRDVDQKGVLELAGELTELSAKARAGKLMPGQMAGGTFSISSLGGIGGTTFSPIINAPEVAILGVTRSAMKPVWDGEAFRPRLMVPLSLSYDHRVIDGALAARFVAHLCGVLNDMRRILL